MKILVNDFCGHPFPVQLSRVLAGDGHSVLHAYFADNNTPKGFMSPHPDDAPGLRIRPLSIDRKFKKHSLWSRRFADRAYGGAVAEEVRKFRPEIVLSANMPLDGQKILLEATRRSDAKFVFWLQDLLSRAMEFTLRKKGVPMAGLAAQAYSRLEGRLLRESDAVVCIAPEFVETVRGFGVSPAKTRVIENWAPLEEVRCVPRNTAWAREHGIAGKFCFLYSGTLGLKHRPELLLELARHFEQREDVVTVVVAQGAGADWLRRKAHAAGRSLLLLPFQPYERLSEVLGAADVLVGILDADCGAFAVPSKTLAYLCAGRPLLLAAPAENLAAKIVRRAGAGETVAEDAPGPFLAAANRLLADHRARLQYAANARAYAERAFDIAKIAEQFLGVMEFALGESPAEGALAYGQLARSVSTAE